MYVFFVLRGVTCPRSQPDKKAGGWTMKAIRLVPIFLTLFLVHAVPCSAGRYIVALSTRPWSLWRDAAAAWVDDPLFLPPVDLARVPVNPPTCGWDRLATLAERTTTLPATVEQFFWGENANDGTTAGDWRGVSWWTTTIDLPDSLAGRRLFLDFASVHLRAEVFVNRELAGYDLIGHTPFSVDITTAARPGARNDIAVRITDPLGNFSWNDRQVLKWGTRDIPAVHGFGGITGTVTLRAIDLVHIGDIAVLNTGDPRRITILITARNLTTVSVKSDFAVRIHPDGYPGDTVWDRTLTRTLPPGDTIIEFDARVRRAELWDIDTPNLYRATAALAGSDGSRDTVDRRFGFRSFTIGEGDGDRRFYLNGRRIVLLSTMTWGFWPENGVFPSPETAVGDIALTRALGLNLINFHRAIGQPVLLDAADEAGVLCYEEPGGYSCEGATAGEALWRDWRREKLLRMVRRDRSRPSLIIYNLQNRTPNEVTDEDISNMRAAHSLDPSRSLTWISGFWSRLPEGEAHPEKLHFAPYDTTAHTLGWWDMHHASPAQSWHDSFYNGPEDYAHFTNNTAEIMFYGEDGSIYCPPKLASIAADCVHNGSRGGWRTADLLAWHDAWDTWLDESGFRAWFSSVDDLVGSIGNVSYDYHRRIIENIRIGNIIDCYTLNGWAGNQLTNHCDIADLYRNPVGDPSILASAARPLYVAVKLRDTVAQAGGMVTADCFLVNEANISGRHGLTVTLSDTDGAVYYTRKFDVRVLGGEVDGQLLVEGIDLHLGTGHGYHGVRAELADRRGHIIAKGGDSVFAVNETPGPFPGNVAVIDTSGVIRRALRDTWGVAAVAYADTMTDPGCVLVGRHAFRGRGQIETLMSRVADGATVIVLADADTFASLLDINSDTTEALVYKGRFTIGQGTHIAGFHPILDGLPQAQAFGREYQCFTWFQGVGQYALRLEGGTTVVAALDSHRKDIGSAISVIPFGRGRVVLSTLDILPHLEDPAPAASVVRRLLYNLAAWGAVAGSPSRD